jgi:hypothetical protein
MKPTHWQVVQALLHYKPISNYILKGILKPMLSEEVNEVNASNYAKERGIAVVETISSREPSFEYRIAKG